MTRSFANGSQLTRSPCCCLDAGIESIFPNESYFAWYQQPTRDALQVAHSRLAERLSPTIVEGLMSNSGKKVATTTSFERENLGVFTPPETPASATPSFPSSRASLSKPLTCQTQRVPGIDTPLSYPSTAGVRTPANWEHGGYDGMICFSQGCAVSTGLLLEMQARLPVRFVVLICGGRPFDANGTMERVATTSTTPIEVPSIHIHGRQDAGLDESRKLASLYSDRGKQVIELDIGHCPPRRTSDLKVVAAAIRSAISELD